MNQKNFAVTKIGCSDSLWSLVLSGKRNFGYKYAKAAAKVLRTTIVTWTDPDTPVELRQNAWKKFSTKRGVKCKN